MNEKQISVKKKKNSAWRQYRSDLFAMCMLCHSWAVLLIEEKLCSESQLMVSAIEMKLKMTLSELIAELSHDILLLIST